MSADEEVDAMIRVVVVLQRLAEHGYEPWVIMARITADMRHEHIHILHAETIRFVERISHVTTIHISEHGTGGLELPQAAQHLITAYIAGMPNFIDILEMLKDALIQSPVCIA